MNHIQMLKEIAASQKTIRTSRLIPILKEIERMYADQGFHIRRLKKEPDRLEAELVEWKEKYNHALNKKGFKG